MVKPNDREKKEVGKITALTRQEVEDLKNILLALGFDYETIALMWNKSPAVVEKAFLNHGLSGHDLLFFCEHIRLRPGVIQRKLNFDRDESRLRMQKVGFKSTRAPAKWVGPPGFCLEGNASDGRAFREVYLSPGVTAIESLDQKVLQQIANGNWPVRLPLLSSVVQSANSTRLEHRKLPRLEAIVDSFPAGIQTVEDVFAPAETQEKRPEEGHKMNKADMTFATSFAAAGLGSKLADFIEKQSLTGWVYENLDWDDDVISMFADGEKGPLPGQLTQFLAHCKQVGILGSEVLKLIQSFCDENGPETDNVSSGQLEPEKGYYEELWFPDCVVFASETIPLVGSDEGVLSKRFYNTLKAVRDAFDLQWGEIEQKLGLSHENIIALQSGKQVLKPKVLEVIPKALKKHFGVDLTIREILGIDELPELHTVTAEAETVNVETSQAEESNTKQTIKEPETVADTTSQSDIPPNGWPQKAIAQFIVQAVAQNDTLVLRDVLASIGRNSHFNAQVLKGKQAYNRRDLEEIAKLLGLSFADVSTANMSVLKVVTESVADGDMQAIARNIARLIESKGLRTFDVLSAVGIRYRPHNSHVVKGIEGYSYTDQQLSDIAAKIGVSVEELRGEVAQSASVATPAPAEVVAELVSDTQAAVSDAPQEVARSSSDYDATDKVLRKVVVAQLRKLRDFLGLTGKEFTAGVPNASKDIYYGLVRVESYVLKGLVQKHKSAAPWLTFEWFLSDADVIVDQVQEPEAEVAQPASPSPEPEPVVESVSPEPVVETEEVPVMQTKEASVPVEEPKPTMETQKPFLQTFAKAYGPKTDQSLDWRKLFFVFAKAGYVKGEVVASLLEPFTVHSNVSVDWQKQVLAVAGPVLQSVNQAPELEDITQDASLMKVLSELSALDVLLLGRALDQSGSRT